MLLFMTTAPTQFQSFVSISRAWDAIGTMQAWATDDERRDSPIRVSFVFDVFAIDGEQVAGMQFRDAGDAIAFAEALIEKVREAQTKHEEG